MAMYSSKLTVFGLIFLLLTTMAVTVYQYSQNIELNSQRATAATRLEMNRILSRVQMNITAQLALIDAAILEACIKLSTMDLMGEDARAVMADLAVSNSFIVNAATADRDDTLLVVAPGEYSNIEAINICYQEQNIKMHAEMRPAMSSMIYLVEGFYGVVMVAPIFDSTDTFIGSLSIVIQPGEIIQAAVSPFIEGTSYSIWAMQTNGTLLYDPDPAQQGKNLFTDPIYINYPSVQEFVQQVATIQAGYGTYTYHQDTTEGEIVNKEAYWATTGIYGTEWRLIILNILSE